MSDFHGYQVDQDLILCDNMKIGDGTATPIDKDTGDPGVSGAAGRMVRAGDSGAAEIRVYSHDALTVGATKSFSIELECYSSDAHAQAASPFRNTADGWLGSGHFHLLYKGSGDGALSFGAGDLITAAAIPQGLLGERSHLQLRIRTDADLSASGLDAFIHPVV